MMMPLAGRWIAAALGGVLVIAGWHSVIGTLIVARPVATWLTRAVDRIVLSVYQMATRGVADYKRRDRLLATQAAAILVGQLASWLLIFLAGFTLLLWPVRDRSITQSLSEAGSSIFTLGFSEPAGSVPDAFVFVAAATGMIVVALQIGYLPTLYSAFNRRETEVALLVARAGAPSWGPELLARTHYALGSGVSTLDTLPALYQGWERWASDVAESHTTYLPLVRFRSPLPYSSWVISLLAVLDSAALILVLSPEEAPTVAARLCLRSGFQCLTRIARAMGMDVPEEANPNARIMLTYEEFVAAVSRMDEVKFPRSREPADAWPDFVGWRVNYESAAYQIAKAVDAVPALWSGPRRRESAPMPPRRPPSGRPEGQPEPQPAEPQGLEPQGLEPQQPAPERPERR